MRPLVQSQYHPLKKKERERERGREEARKERKRKEGKKKSFLEITTYSAEGVVLENSWRKEKLTEVVCRDRLLN
jgi:hypothetical protein